MTPSGHEAVSRPRNPGVESARSRTLATYSTRVQVTDAILVGVSILAAAYVRFTPDDGSQTLSEMLTSSDPTTVTFRVIAPLLFVAWLISLRFAGAYDPRFAGLGTAEYAAVTRATFVVFSALAIISYALKLQIARGFVVLALPAGLLALLISHLLWRLWLTRRRARGHLLHRVLVVGDQASARQLISTLDKRPEAGYSVVAVCSTFGDDDGDHMIDRVPVIGTELQAADLAREMGVDVVACTTSAGFGSLAIRKLSWHLEGSDIEVIVVPDLIDVAGPRIATRPINGIPLLLIEQPRFGGAALAIKTIMDKVGSSCALLIAGPFLLAIAIAIKLDDRGPVLFRQERVGINGENFTMIKFRSMRVGADLEHAKMMLDTAQDTDRGPMFKMQDDPRVTRVGKFIRKTSLDEFPQFWNILRGDMSLVGPRPPLPSEAESYDSAAMRRLLVKPGLTGMWQVSGRSNLSWQESVRLDLYYVENWTLIGDIMIMFRTVKTVLAREGAY